MHVNILHAALLLPWLNASDDQRSRRRVQCVSMVGGAVKKINYVCTVEVSGNHIWMAVYEERRESEAATSHVNDCGPPYVFPAQVLQV